MIYHVEISWVVGLSQKGGHEVGLMFADAPLSEDRNPNETHSKVVMVSVMDIFQKLLLYSFGGGAVRRDAL